MYFTSTWKVKQKTHSLCSQLHYYCLRKIKDTSVTVFVMEYLTIQHLTCNINFNQWYVVIYTSQGQSY